MCTDEKDRGTYYPNTYTKKKKHGKLPSDLNGLDKSFHSAQKPEHTWRVPTRLSSDLRLSAHTNGGPQQEGGPAQELSCHQLLLWTTFTWTEQSTHGLMQGCVGNCDAPGMTWSIGIQWCGQLQNGVFTVAEIKSGLLNTFFFHFFFHNCSDSS